jgi:hypothetical protein
MTLSLFPIAGQITKKKKEEEMIDLIDMPETDQNWSIFSK